MGSKCYSHFTSPIRRYPDLILHRLVKDYMNSYSIDIINSWEEKLPDMSLHCSVKEQDAQNCERDVDNMKMAEYIGDEQIEQAEEAEIDIKNIGGKEESNIIQVLLHTEFLLNYLIL